MKGRRRARKRKRRSEAGVGASQADGVQMMIPTEEADGTCLGQEETDSRTTYSWVTLWIVGTSAWRLLRC